jgi:hypothetical protein
MTTTRTPPSFVVKATDALAYPLVTQYARICRDFGQEDQAQQMAAAAEEIRVWQNENPERVHMPTHQHIPHRDPPQDSEPSEDEWRDDDESARRS